MSTALERRFPALGARLARAPFTALPTPVERLARLGAANGVELWVKRDDRSGTAYGGNKPRKLELVLGDAVRRGATSVLTFGGIGTHHGLATTIFGRQVGVRTILVLVPQPVTAAVRRSLLIAHAAGAELHVAPSVARVAATALALVARGLARGERPYVIAAGGSSVLGTLGYVGAALELAEQVRAGDLPEPATIVVPVGTGGTAAGLVLGLRLAGLRSRVRGVLVTDILPPSRRRLLGLARRALGRLRRLDPSVPAVALRPADLELETGFVGAGYGAATAAAEAARRLMADSEGIELETTYTAKALAALLASTADPGMRAALLARAGDPGARAAPLLFWNTFSSVDPAAALGRLPDPSELPAACRRFFA